MDKQDRVELLDELVNKIDTNNNKFIGIGTYRRVLSLIRQQKALQMKIYEKYYELEEAVKAKARKDGHGNL